MPPLQIPESLLIRSLPPPDQWLSYLKNRLGARFLGTSKESFEVLSTGYDSPEPTSYPVLMEIQEWQREGLRFRLVPDGVHGFLLPIPGEPIERLRSLWSKLDRAAFVADVPVDPKRRISSTLESFRARFPDSAFEVDTRREGGNTEGFRMMDVDLNELSFDLIQSSHGHAQATIWIRTISENLSDPEKFAQTGFGGQVLGQLRELGMDFQVDFRSG